MTDTRRPDPRFYSEVVYHGPGWYAWRTRADGVQRWYQVQRTVSATPEPVTLEIVRQQGLIGLVCVDDVEELKASYVEALS